MGKNPVLGAGVNTPHAPRFSFFFFFIYFFSAGLVQIPVSMYQTVVTSLAQGNGPVQVAMAPVTTRIADSAVTMDGQAVEVVTLEQ